LSYSFYLPEIKEYIKLEIPEDVYYPDEDSFLLLETLIKTMDSNTRLFLEIGGGSGLITIALAKFFPQIRFLINDVSFSSTETIYYNIRLNNTHNIIDVFQMDTISGLRAFNPDIIVWNPPYLPLDEDVSLFSKKERKMLFGGKNGYEQAYAFIDLCLRTFFHSTIFIVLSSLGWDPSMLPTLVQKDNVTAEIVNKKKLPFETLFVIKINF